MDDQAGIQIAPDVKYEYIESYSGEKPYIFISYAHKDTSIVFKEVAQLCSMGYRVWYDEGIDPGNEWTADIANALEKSALFIVFISSNSVASKNVRNEIHFALDMDKPFLAIYIEETMVPNGLKLSIGSIQAIMKYRMQEEMYHRKLIKVLPEVLRENGVCIEGSVTLSLLLGRTKSPIKQISELCIGDVIALNQLTKEPLKMVVLDTVIGSGKIGIINGSICAEVIEMIQHTPESWMEFLKGAIKLKAIKSKANKLKEIISNTMPDEPVYNNVITKSLDTIDIAVEVANKSIPTDEVLKIKSGDIIEFDIRSADLLVEIKTEEILLAKGEIVSVDDNFGVRIVELIK